MEVDSRLPFAVKGFEFDPVNAFTKAQAVKGTMLSNEGQVLQNRGAGLRNDLASLQLDEAKGRAGALSEYRKAAAAGDESATEKLAAYPDIQLQMRQTLDGLKEQDRLDTLRKGQNVADAARRVSAIKPGPEQIAAWNAELDALVESGDIDPAFAEQARDNPSPLVLSEALRMGETLEQYIARSDAEASRQLEERKAHPETWEDLTLSQKLDVWKAATERVKAANGNSIVPLKPEEQQAAFDAAVGDIMTGLGLEPPSTSVKPKGKGKKKKGGGSAAPTSPTAGTKPAGSAEVEWESLSPEAQADAAKTLMERLADPSVDREAEIADFNAYLGEGIAEAIIRAHGG